MTLLVLQNGGVGKKILVLHIFSPKTMVPNLVDFGEHLAIKLNYRSLILKNYPTIILNLIFRGEYLMHAQGAFVVPVAVVGNHCPTTNFGVPTRDSSSRRILNVRDLS